MFRHFATFYQFTFLSHLLDMQFSHPYQFEPMPVLTFCRYIAPAGLPIYHFYQFTILAHLSVGPFLPFGAIFGPASFDVFTIFCDPGGFTILPFYADCWIFLFYRFCRSVPFSPLLVLTALPPLPASPFSPFYYFIALVGFLPFLPVGSIPGPVGCKPDFSIFCGEPP